MSDHPPTFCDAPPGYFCSPLNDLTHCPTNWYCPGGVLPAQRCPDGKWSNAGSMYLEDCADDMSVQSAVLVSLIIITVALCCCYLAYWDWICCCWQGKREYPEAEYVRRQSQAQRSTSEYGAVCYMPVNNNDAAPSAPCGPQGGWCYSARGASRVIPTAVLNNGQVLKYAQGVV